MLPVRLPKRFEVVRQLGQGGMGTVYEATDRDTGAKLAIKLLPSSDPRAVARFKREFRALQDIHHPNLLPLRELFCEEGQWAFSMDLVAGTDFIDYVCHDESLLPDLELFNSATKDSAPDALDATFPGRAFGPTAPATDSPSLSEHDLPVPPRQPSSRPAPRFDEMRLRSALRQLCSALALLHAGDKVHRDIKPSNIRVREDGHLFLLDFGIIAELSTGQHLTADGSVMGTPEFMAPEQAAAHASVGPPADMYSVGVLLFACLTGQLPFVGSLMQLILAKQHSDAPDPARWSRNVPDDLNALCTALLSRDPTARPTAAQVLQRLALSDIDSERPHARPIQSTLPPPFVGRQGQLSLLDDAFARVLLGQPETLLLEGESGTGKSYLARRFLDRVQLEHRNALVVPGACYENEAVPYNAWDAAMEWLASYWSRLPAAAAAALIPSHIGPLTQTFPALLRVPILRRMAERPSPKLDAREVRGRAFAALRDLFERLSQNGPLIVFLDDLHWADRDSTSLLAELLREPYPPPFLLLATTRPLAEYPLAESQLRDALPRAAQRAVVSELPADDAIELATTILGRIAPDLASEAPLIAREARGHALFISELARHVADRGRDSRELLSLEAAIFARVAREGEDAQRLLRILSLSGRPLPESVALRTADVGAESASAVLGALRTARLILTRRLDGVEWVQPFHDRVRKAMAEKEDATTRRALFEKLALAFEAHSPRDPNTLTDFWRAAGDAERAGRYAREAGDLARAALAFGRAAGFYETALARPSCTAEERHELLVDMADALAEAGRGLEAARIYQQAAIGRGDEEALRLEQRAGEQLLRVGRSAEGIMVTRRVLARVGIRWPTSVIETVITFIALQIFLSVRGRRFTARSESGVPRSELTRIDVCQNIGVTMMMIDGLKAFVFSLHHLRLALRAGELRRVSLAASLELMRTCSANGGESPRQRRQRERLTETAVSLAEKVGQPYERAVADFARGCTLVTVSRPHEALLFLNRAETAYREECAGRTWELTTCQLWQLFANIEAGRFKDAAAVQGRALTEATDRNDLYGMIYFRAGYATVASLARDEVLQAREALATATSLMTTSDFTLERFYAWMSLVSIGLYTGESVRIEEEVRRGSKLFQRSGVRFVPAVSEIWRVYVIGFELALAAERASQRRTHVARASAMTDQLSRMTAASAAPFVSAFRGQIAFLNGETERATALLRTAAERFDRIDYAAFSAMARHACGEIVQGEEGSTLIDDAEQRLKEAGVKNVRAFCRLLVPTQSRDQRAHVG